MKKSGQDLQDFQDYRSEANRVNPVNPVYFFSDAAAVQRLRTEIDSWLGTPFHAGSQAKGRTGGVDCIRLCEAVMIALKVVEPFSFPEVPMDFTQHQDRSILLEFLRGEYRPPISASLALTPALAPPEIDPQSLRLAARFAPIWTADNADNIPPHRVSEAFTRPGDLLCFEIGKAVNHIGIVYDGARFLHCFTRIGTVLANITDPNFSSRLHTIFRARKNETGLTGLTGFPESENPQNPVNPV